MAPTRKYHKWTASENAYLHANYGKLHYSEIAKVLSISQRCLHKRIYDMRRKHYFPEKRVLKEKPTPVGRGYGKKYSLPVGTISERKSGYKGYTFQMIKTETGWQRMSKQRVKREPGPK